MTGGVSNDVFSVTGPGIDVVVKRALDRLRVAQLWIADPARLSTEGRALRLAGRLLPELVPEVFDLSDGYLVIERAPRTWHVWRDELLAGAVRGSVAERLGHALGSWQRTTALNPRLGEEFVDRTVFTQLRTDPFHRTIRQRHPDLADAIDLTLTVMDRTVACLVHGDFTPKNMLTAAEGTGLWVIDWEVAHLGDPTFDPAWLVGHLMLKAIHRPALRLSYARAAHAFRAAHRAALGAEIAIDEAQLVRQVGCLLLARIDGTSPVDYLDAPARERARAVGRRLLSQPAETLAEVWEHLN